MLLVLIVEVNQLPILSLTGADNYIKLLNQMIPSSHGPPSSQSHYKITRSS